MMGHSQKEDVVFNHTIGPPKAVTSGMTACVSAPECIGMDAQALPPLVIHRGSLPNAPLGHLVSAYQGLPRLVLRLYETLPDVSF